MKHWFVKEKENVAKRRALEVRNAQQLYLDAVGPEVRGGGRGAVLKEQAYSNSSQAGYKSEGTRRNLALGVFLVEMPSDYSHCLMLCVTIPVLFVCLFHLWCTAHKTQKSPDNKANGSTFAAFFFLRTIRFSV